MLAACKIIVILMHELQREVSTLTVKVKAPFPGDELSTSFIANTWYKSAKHVLAPIYTSFHELGKGEKTA